MDYPHQREWGSMKRVRKLQVKWAKKQTEKLIKEVERREELWNASAKDYKDRYLRRELWEDVAKEMDLPRHEVTTKWNSLRSFYRMMHNKITENPEEQVTSNETYNMLKFLEPALRLEPRPPRNSTVSNISENSLNMVSAEEFSDDLKENIELFMPAQSSNKRTRFDEQEENYNIHVVNNAASSFEVSVKSDIWDTVGKFVALNGREWAKENHKLANQFKAAIYKLLADFQEKASETQESTKTNRQEHCNEGFGKVQQKDQPPVPIPQSAQALEQNQCQNNEKIIAIDNRLSNIEARLTTIEKECKTHSGSCQTQSLLLDKILNQTKRPYQIIEDQLTERRSQSNNRSNIPPENFNDLAELKIRTTDELNQFEANLENDEYRERFIRYLNFKFTMNGYQNGAAFFVELFRLLLDNSMLMPYSWAGISRNGKKNISFQQEHKTFVKHMINFVIMADKTQNESLVTKYFAKALRFKNIYGKREANRTSAGKRFGLRTKSRRMNIAEQTANQKDEKNITNEILNFDIKVEPSDYGGAGSTMQTEQCIIPADNMKTSNEKIDGLENENYGFFEEDDSEDEELEDEELLEAEADDFY